MNYNRFYPLFVLFSLDLLLSLKPASASTFGMSGARVRCIESERQSLLKFKQGLVDEYDILSSWDNGDGENNDCCKWWGVKCSNRTGHVIVLDLHQDLTTSRQLRGEVSLSLLVGLQHLRYLDLSYNDFYGSKIGDVIGSHHRLKHLNLTGVDFTGVVPHQLGNLTSLQTLQLGWNDFSGEIPHQLGNLTSLRTLDLGGNSGLTTNNLEWLSQLRLLRQLDLSTIHLNGTNWVQVIFGLPFLEELNLESCGLGDATTPSLLLLPNSSSKSLSILDLSGNSLTYSSTYSWFFNISNNLVSIDLFGNELNGPIPDAFGAMTCLEEIYLGGNGLIGGIPNSFQNLSHLRTLSLWANNLGESFTELVHKLSSSAETSLENLNLYANRFWGSLTNITRFSSLRDLDLSNNQFNGSLMQNLVLPSSLVSLYLENNQITGDLFIRPSLDGLSQPSNLPVSSSLRSLNLHNNKFTGRISDSIGQFSELVDLDLSSNSFVDTISEVHFSRLSNLKTLHLASNSLTFNISHEWVPPFRLDFIDLANCSSGPHFPRWLKTQNNFSFLDLSSNGILDVMPNWFWDLSPKLEHLNLSHNQISGSLSELSQKFDKYLVIDLSFNDFSASILSVPRNLLALHLHRNMFVGSVSFLCTIDFSNGGFSTFDLSDNLFSGDLPNCWMNKTGLAVLNLANNNFSGRIPESIGFLRSLLILHLRNNSFVGEIPSSIKNCSSLEVIDVAGNQLTSNIPSWIGMSLTSLVFLSLQSNNFYGNIPREMCHLSQIQVLDLSRNNITGKIPHCFNNFTCLVQKNCSSSHTVLYIQEHFRAYAYYMDNMWVQWKRKESEYTKTLNQLKIIDLSSNKLVGQIPQEIASLRGLISLNLSINRLTGKIISHIDQMEMLESLDLSRNQLSGEIPNGLAHLNYLALLDLSNNNLSGRIPTSTQLQSFNASTYTGNNGLCGPPLEECPRDVVDPRTADDGKDDDVENEDEFSTKEFYVCMGLGFLVGLLGVIAVLFKDSWRNAYFRFLMRICDLFYVASILYWARLKRMLSG